MSQEFALQRTFECDPRDLSVAFNVVGQERYGKNAFLGIRRNWKSLWSRAPLEFLTIKSGIDTRVIGITGGVCIPAIPAMFALGSEMPVVAVYGIDEHQKDEVDAFFDAIALHVRTNSIYRGKAVDSEGQFLDLSGIALDDMVYNSKVMRDLSAHVWTMIRRSELCGNVRIKRSRKLLFSGPYGSGKTVAALITGQIGLAHQFTFVYVRPTAQRADGVIQRMIAFARHYQPAILFIEDWDREQREGNRFEHGAILTEIDGIKGKRDAVIVLMTTNHSKKVADGAARPGRIDKEIDFSVFTSADMEYLLRKIIPASWLHPDIEWQKVTEACKAYTGAFVSEVGNASMLLALADQESTGIQTPIVTTALLIEAANDLRGQHDRSNVRLGFT